MPSPIGHALAGALAASLLTRGASATDATHRPPWHVWRDRRWLGAVAVAVLPDADLLLPVTHRTLTHSLLLTGLIFIVWALVTGWVTRRIRWRGALLLALAHASHVGLDWLGADPNPPAGVALWWPWSRQFFVSAWTVFPPVDRRLLTVAAWQTNAWAALVEIAWLGPVLAASVLWAGRRARLRVEPPDLDAAHDFGTQKLLQASKDHGRRADDGRDPGA